MNTETRTPNIRYSRKGTTINQIRLEISKESSQKNAAAINRITRTGSLAIVKQNSANGSENAIKLHPKNSATVIFYEN